MHMLFLLGKSLNISLNFDVNNVNIQRLSAVAHVYNHSYSGGKDGETVV
jgi:hypothetical protein